MKSNPRYEFTFAVNDAIAESLIRAVRRSDATMTDGEQVMDRYYSRGSVDSTATKFQQFRVRRINCCWSVALQCKSWKKET
ncbi:MAG: hypothetical protein WBD20_06945, partial [Pirellulaceae bacterium]